MRRAVVSSSSILRNNPPPPLRRRFPSFVFFVESNSPFFAKRCSRRLLGGSNPLKKKSFLSTTLTTFVQRKEEDTKTKGGDVNVKFPFSPTQAHAYASVLERAIFTKWSKKFLDAMPMPLGGEKVLDAACGPERRAERLLCDWEIRIDFQRLLEWTRAKGWSRKHEKREEKKNRKEQHRSNTSSVQWKNLRRRRRRTTTTTPRNSTGRIVIKARSFSPTETERWRIFTKV